MLTLFTFTFAKRRIQCNIAHRSHIRTFLAQTHVLAIRTADDLIIFCTVKFVLLLDSNYFLNETEEGGKDYQMRR